MKDSSELCISTKLKPTCSGTLCDNREANRLRKQQKLISNVWRNKVYLVLIRLAEGKPADEAKPAREEKQQEKRKE